MGKYGRNGSVNGGGGGGGNRRNDYIARPAAGRVQKAAAFGVGAANDSKKVLAKFDARLKLLEKQDALQVAQAFGQQNSGRFIRDARELLNRREKSAKKAEMRKEIAAYERGDHMDKDDDEDDDEEQEQAGPGFRNGGGGGGGKRQLTGKSKSSEPVVIVTGLGNIRKKGDKIEVVNSTRQFAKQHQVLSNGVSTLVTVDNDLARQRSRNKAARNGKQQEEDEDEEEADYLKGRTTSNLKNLAPLKIRVENDLARRNSDDRSSSPPYQRRHGGEATQTFYNSNHRHHAPPPPPPSHSHHYEPASYARAPPSSTIAYPPSLSSSSSSNEGRLSYNGGSGGGYAPSHYGSHHSHHYHEARPIRRPSPPPSEYRYQPAAPPPVQSYHTNHGNHHHHHNETEMDYEESEPVRQAPPPPQPPPVVKSALSSSRGRLNMNENGYRVVVSNLHPNVTQEDILELFSDIGPIKRAKFIERGVAEVIYVNLDDAYSAIKKYDQKELDGRAMKIELTSNNAPVAKSSTRDPSPEKPITRFTTNNNTAAPAPPPADMGANTLSNRFKAYPINANVEKIALPEPSKSSKSRNPIKVNQVDASIIQQVLFNKKPPLANSNPVTFTVKL